MSVRLRMVSINERHPLLALSGMELRELTLRRQRAAFYSTCTNGNFSELTDPSTVTRADNLSAP